MYVLSCHIFITSKKHSKTISFSYVNQVSVKTSVKNFTDTAEIIVPRKLLHKGDNIREFVSRGDEIRICLGYDGTVGEVFTGYVTKVSSGTPIKITCENEAWQLKQIMLSGKTYPKLNLQDFVDEHMSDYASFIAEVSLGEVIINSDVSLAQVFEYITKNYNINFYFNYGKMFWGVLPSVLSFASNLQNTVKFKIGMNTISDNLVYTLAEDVKVQIVGKTILRDNTKLEWKEPQNATDCDIRTFLLSLESLAELKQRVKELHDEFKIDKMTGSFTAFGTPFVRKGDIVHIYDDLNIEERNDKKFFVEAVDYDFGQNGYRQTIHLGGEIKQIK